MDLPCAQDAGAVSRFAGILSEPVGMATGSQPGPVHLNVTFREPLLEDSSGDPIQAWDWVTSPPEGEFYVA